MNAFKVQAAGLEGVYGQNLEGTKTSEAAATYIFNQK